eukprot:1528943-Prymnesium_polylepis.1
MAARLQPLRAAAAELARTHSASPPWPSAPGRSSDSQGAGARTVSRPEAEAKAEAACGATNAAPSARPTASAALVAVATASGAAIV